MSSDTSSSGTKRSRETIPTQGGEVARVQGPSPDGARIVRVRNGCLLLAGQVVLSCLRVPPPFFSCKILPLFLLEWALSLVVIYLLLTTQK